MKPLDQYPTPETDAESPNDDCCGMVSARLSRDLERRLVACREALDEVLGCISETRGKDATLAVINARETLTLTTPKP